MNRTGFRFCEADIAPDLPPDIAPNLLKTFLIGEEKRASAVLGLGITDLCNLKCPFCYYRQDGASGKHTVMTPDFLKRILKGVGRVGTIMIGLEGEPLCHPDFRTMAELCSCHADNVVLVTNGLLVTSDTVGVLNECGVKAVFLSCDAVTPETYGRLRCGGSLEVFSRNARLLAASFGGGVCLHSVVTEVNWRELVLLPEFARDLGITRLSLTQLRNNEWSELNGIRRATAEEIREFAVAVCRTAERCGVSIVFDYLFGDRDLGEWLRGELKAFSCARADLASSCLSPWTAASVLADGRVFPCCGDIAPVRPEALNFDGIFNCRALLRLRYALSGPDLPEVCRKCREGEYR